MLKMLLNPTRQPDESQAAYRERRALGNRYGQLPVYQRAGELEFLSWL